MKNIEEYSTFVDVDVPAGLPEIAAFCFQQDDYYGYMFYNPVTEAVVVTHEDGAEYIDEVIELLDMVDDVNSLATQPCILPRLDEGWLVLLPSDDGWRFAEWTEGSERYVMYLK